MPASTADDDLMKEISNGNHSAFEELFARHRAAVFGYCMRMLGGRKGAAEDISQDVWFKVIRKAGTYNSRGYFKAWLMTMTRNESITVLRKQKRFSDSEALENDEISGDFDLEQALLSSYDRERVTAAIDSLSDSQRVALSLSLREDLSNSEVAQTMGLTVSSVKALLVRAKRNLKKQLEKP